MIIIIFNNIKNKYSRKKYIYNNNNYSKKKI